MATDDRPADSDAVDDQGGRGAPEGARPSYPGLLSVFGRGLVTGVASMASTGAVAVAVAVTGPLIARRLRFAKPWHLVFAAPAGWLAVWACVGVPSNHWLLNNVIANVAILLILYCLPAWSATVGTFR